MFGLNCLLGHQRFTDAHRVLSHDSEFVFFTNLQVFHSRCRTGEECTDFLPAIRKQKRGNLLNAIITASCRWDDNNFLDTLFFRSTTLNLMSSGVVYFAYSRQEHPVIQLSQNENTLMNRRQCHKACHVLIKNKRSSGTPMCNLSVNF